MTPGRELDALVAEKVMGCAPYRGKGDPTVFFCGCKPLSIHDDPHPQGLGLSRYSLDIEAAWKVVERMNADGWLLRLRVAVAHRSGDNVAQFVRSGFEAPAFSGTVAEAICLAALKAVEA